MHFAIEVSPSTNPLTLESLYKVLESAVSSSQQRLQTSSQQLQNWEKTTGYYSLLQDVFIDASIPYPIRYVAIIQFKNGINKWWRGAMSANTSSAERDKIRALLIESGISQEDRKLAVENAIATSKIIRYECPARWPDPFTSLLNAIRSAAQPGVNPLSLPRTLLILLHTVKELQSARLLPSNKILRSMAPEIVFVLIRAYVERARRWQSSLSAGAAIDSTTFADLESSLLAIKILRRLVTGYLDRPHQAKEVPEFWSVMRDQFDEFLIYLPAAYTKPSDAQILVGKHLLQLGKFHLGMAEEHPAAFALLPGSVALTRAYWGLIGRLAQDFGTKSASVPAKILTDGDASDDKPSILERLGLKGLLLLRECVRMVFQPRPTFKYRTTEDKDDQTRAKELLSTELLTPSLAHEVMEIIVTRFFVFRSSDLREWEEQPDEWEEREDGGGDAWMFSIRGASEKLFMDLIHNFKDTLLQPLLNVFNTVSTSASEDVLFKDSIYTAIGLAAPVLKGTLDFDSFLASTLVVEVQKQRPGFHLLRRRIAILIGQWIVVEVSRPSRAVIYEIFRHLLNGEDPLNDQVVRVTAARQFKIVADEWEFDIEAFAPHAPELLSRLMSLVKEVELTETKMALLNTVSVIVERMGHQIMPYTESIVALLSPLWEQSSDEPIMQQVIFVMLTRLIHAMKADSKIYHPLVLPLVSRVIEPDSPLQLHLLDDALDLWAAVLAQTVHPVPSELIRLALHLEQLYTLGSDSLRKVLEITESYLLLAPNEMLQDGMRTLLLTKFTGLLGTVRQAHAGIVTHLVEVMIRSAESLGGASAVDVVVTGLIQTQFLGRLIDGLMTCWRAQHGPEDNRPVRLLDSVVETDYFSVLSRILLVSPALFVKAVGAMEVYRADTAAPGSAVLDILLDEWFTHFGDIGNPSQRKLSCLALTRLLEGGDKVILGRMKDLITVWTDVVAELQDGQFEKGVDSMVYIEETRPSTMEAPEDERRRHFTFTDPIHQINAMRHIQQHLIETIARCGGQEAFQRDWLATIDPSILQSFAALELL